MCPSFQATREEMHSTRGRARLLWEALSGNGLLERGIIDPALKEALELCLSCKACKTECPAAIDMAAYKAEFFAHYYQNHRRPPDVRFFAHIHELARIGAAAPRIANALSHAPVVGAIARRRLKVHPGRELPRFAASDLMFTTTGTSQISGYSKAVARLTGKIAEARTKLAADSGHDGPSTAARYE